MSSDIRRAQVVRIGGLKPVCPPLHLGTNAWPLVSQMVTGARHIELYLVEILPDGEGLPDRHPGCEHGFFVLSGRGRAQVEGSEYELEPEDCLFIPDGAIHSIKTIGSEPLRMVVFMAPHRGIRA